MKSREIPLDTIDYVEEADIGLTSVLYIHFEEDGTKKSDAITFLPGMEGEVKEAIALFRDHGIPVSSRS